MSGTRVKSKTAAEEAKPSADPKAPAGAGKPAEALSEEEGEEDALDAEEPASGAENAAEEAEDAEDGEAEEESDENEVVSGLTTEEVAAGQRRAGKKRKVVEPPEIPDGHQAILSSPRDFGIWIDGKLHRFSKGRTPLTEEQHDACHTDSYVRDNGASVSYRPAKKVKAK